MDQAARSIGLFLWTSTQAPPCHLLPHVVVASYRCCAPPSVTAPPPPPSPSAAGPKPPHDAGQACHHHCSSSLLPRRDPSALSLLPRHHPHRRSRRQFEIHHHHCCLTPTVVPPPDADASASRLPWLPLPLPTKPAASPPVTHRSRCATGTHNPPSMLPLLPSLQATHGCRPPTAPHLHGHCLLFPMVSTIACHLIHHQSSRLARCPPSRPKLAALSVLQADLLPAEPPCLLPLSSRRHRRPCGLTARTPLPSTISVAASPSQAHTHANAGCPKPSSLPRSCHHPSCHWLSSPSLPAFYLFPIAGQPIFLLFLATCNQAAGRPSVQAPVGPPLLLLPLHLPNRWPPLPPPWPPPKLAATISITPPSSSRAT